MRIKIFFGLILFVGFSFGAIIVFSPQKQDRVITNNELRDIVSSNTDICETNDQFYTAIPEEWFYTRGLPFVTQFFSDNQVRYAKEMMDCENIAELFIALLNTSYFIDHKDNKKAQIIIGHIVMVDKRNGELHDTVVFYLHNEWIVIEPLDFLKTWVDNPSKLSDEMKTIVEISLNYQIKKIKF